jgi:hypothetical protein
MRPTGYFQDIQDDRDFTFGSLEKPKQLPKKASALASTFDVLPPAQTGESCVGFSISTALVAVRKHRAKKNADPITLLDWPSPRFIWWASRYTHHAAQLNTGTFMRSAIKQIGALGVAPERTCPSFDGQDGLLFGRRPSATAFYHAADTRPALRYYRIDGVGDVRIAHWAAALSSGKPVVFGVPVDKGFFDWQGGEPLEPPNPLEVVGGHAMCALAYDEKGVYGPNSYGVEWGNDGWFHLSWAYIGEAALDQWVLEEQS